MRTKHTHRSAYKKAHNYMTAFLIHEMKQEKKKHVTGKGR